MSWSFSGVGRPERIVEALEAHMADDPSYCGDEYRAVKPYLIGLVRRCFATEESGHESPLVCLEASGFGAKKDGREVHSSVSVRLERIHGRVYL